MKVFVTGASGSTGLHFIPKLLAAGHTVVGLARSPESIAKLEAIGVTAVKGGIEDLEVVAKAAAEADAVAHLAFDHHLAFFGKFGEACEKDRAVIKAICDALASKASASYSPLFIVASGTLGIQGQLETDEAGKNPAMPRYLSTELAFSYVAKGLRVVQIRFAPVTYGGPERIHNFIAGALPKYKELGQVFYPEGGVWPACPVDDIADLYARVIDSTNLPNPVTLHGIAEEGVPHAEVAKVLGKKLNLPTKAVSRDDEVMGKLGFVGMAMSRAAPAKSDYTKEVTGWQPKGESLIALLERWNPESV